MTEPKTPVNRRKLNEINIPPSPLMQQLGYGTGVGVYKFTRTATTQNQAPSPWAVKKLIKRNGELASILGKRLTEEADILRKLDHPNIVGFRGYLNDAGGKKCLIMEQCSIGLGDLIEERFENNENPFAAKQIMKVAYDIAKALNYLHNDALLLHNDIKSFNILIKDDFDICKLCDFGVCIPLKSDGCVDDNKIDATHVMYGTEPWAPPETLKFPKKMSCKCDIFAFGLVFWEMLALQPPPSLKDEDSITSLDESSDLIMYRTNFRPDLPVYNFNDEYNCVLELFYCCTSEQPCERPFAKDLITISQSIMEQSGDLLK